MSDDLLARLRKVESGDGTGGNITNWLRNPDGPEAADEITRLRAENARLREASGVLLDQSREPVTVGGAEMVPVLASDLRALAAALKETADDQ